MSVKRKTKVEDLERGNLGMFDKDVADVDRRASGKRRGGGHRENRIRERRRARVLQASFADISISLEENSWPEGKPIPRGWMI